MLTKHRLVYNRYIVHLLFFQMSDLFLFSYCIDAISVLMSSMFCFYCILIKTVITVNTQPVHFSALAYFVFTYNRNIILYVTSYNTRTTTSTSIQIDCHNPVVTWC